MLETTVSRALGHEATLVGDWTVAPIKYDAFNPVSAGLYRLSGTARSALATSSWSLVVKICHEPQEEWLARLPADRRAAEPAFFRWDRDARSPRSTDGGRRSIGFRSRSVTSTRSARICSAVSRAARPRRSLSTGRSSVSHRWRRI